MALPATDAFTGANGTALPTYSSNWANNTGSFVINTNAVAPSGAAAECGARWTADTFSADQYSQCVLAAKEGTSNFEVGVGVRHAAAAVGTYYGYYQDGLNAGACFKLVAGGWTQLGAAFGSLAASGTMRLEVSGTTLTVYHGGVSQGTRTDAAIASGVAGLVGFGSSTSQRADTWEGGNLVLLIGARRTDPRKVINRGPRGMPRFQARRGNTVRVVAQSIAVGLVTSTNTALSIGKRKAKAIGLASSSNTALVCRPTRRKPVGLCTSTNTALALAHAKRKTLGLCTSTNTALATRPNRLMPIGLVTSTNTALAIAHTKRKTLGLATSTNTALPITSSVPTPGGWTSGWINWLRRRLLD